MTDVLSDRPSALQTNVAESRRAEAAQVLADAFADDKLWAKVRPFDADRAERALYQYFRGEVEICARAGGFVHAAYGSGGKITGVLLAYPPGRSPFPWFSVFLRLKAMFLIGVLTSLRMVAMLSKAKSHQLKEPHLYCWYVGSSALGGGGLLFKRAMAYAREHRIPCYGEAKGEGVAEMCEVLGWTLGPDVELTDGVAITPLTWRPPSGAGPVGDPPPQPKTGRVTGVSIRHPKLVLGTVGVLALLCALLGGLVQDRLSAGGFVNPSSESSRVANILAEDYDIGGMQLILTVSAPDVRSGDAAARADAIEQTLRDDPAVRAVVSPWSDPGSAASLFSDDGELGVIVAAMAGDDATAPAAARAIADDLTGEFGDVTVGATGQAVVFHDVNAQAAEDLTRAEMFALPIAFLLLVLFLRSLVGAAIPVVIGGIGIVMTSAVLYLFTLITDVSVFALNIATALGLALAIDYSLLIISRYREELGRGHDQTGAIAVACARAGRAVRFSGITVALVLVGTLVFPMPFLRSVAYAGIAVVILSVVLATVCVPAALTLLGTRINKRVPADPPPVESSRLFRLARSVQARPWTFGLPVLALLLALGAPALGLNVSLPDDRVLPASAQAHVGGDQVRDHLSTDPTGAVDIVLVDADGASTEAVDGYARELSTADAVTGVVTPSAAFVDGTRVGPGNAAAAQDGAVHLRVNTTVDPYSSQARAQLDALRAVPAPGDVLFGGLAQQTRDTKRAIMDGFPLAAVWIAASMFVLIMLLTGSVILPLKALVLNTLSLLASFGAVVWIFQDGHLGGLGTTVTGYTVATVPVLLFCFAFGISMDYEVFLLARFREEWDSSAKTAADNDRAVAVGIARSGRVITAAALIMAVVFAGMITSEVSLMRIFGVVLTVAVLVDATLLRMVLVPAFMRIAGVWNWWAPGFLRPVLERAQLRE
ncbi:MMPL family transporter [Gordonia sp. HNM0687]|uniref:MMPL family transporter n=1 Tax=Gordonia mangrovi TaxID=2665643 RepID=A0A6L7GSA2_9ACTN|nr:MMPL family transporter [Gordonia mangrovi]MXP22786.1 MMPL family transporter [Gordonia mangrovi]UVF77100.1 MMPL family transporter [Gordonia mangrovi]